MALVGSWLDGVSDYSMVVAGDLNSDYKASHASLVADVVPEFGLRNAATEAGGLPGSGMNEYTPTYNFHHASVFDYVLLSEQLYVRSMTTEPIGSHRSPNDTHGSDHFPVTCSVSF